MVPAYCRATYDRRLLVGETPESVLAPIQAELDRLAAEDPSFRVRASFARGEARCYTGNPIQAQRFFPGWLRDREEPFIRDILAGLEAAGLTPAVTQYSFCTNGSHYAGEAGIPTVDWALRGGPSPHCGRVCGVSQAGAGLRELLCPAGCPAETLKMRESVRHQRCRDALFLRNAQRTAQHSLSVSSKEAENSARARATRSSVSPLPQVS